ncbi:Ig-like domain-containing protein [Longimicrobium sp.]|uniref:Ig-like domain-containing protein n=1 Tax=Longimicrobium sp. TaxID=2029185 RepID=UPI003B3A8492
MKRLLLVTAAALLTVSAACENGPTDPAEVVSVQVMPEERTLAVGETLEMEVTVRDAEGESPDHVDEITWASDNPAVATVNTAGVVTGVAPGQANIRAELDGIAGSVRVMVAAAPAACSAPGAVRSLAVGGSVTLGGVEASSVCLDGGAAGAEYVAVPFHSGKINGGFANVQFSAQGVTGVLAASPSVAPALALSGGRPLDEEFHQRLRMNAERELAPYVGDAVAAGRAPRDAMRPSLVLNLRNPTVGQTVQVNTSTEESCAKPSMRTGRVVAVGTRSVVLADVANPSGGLTDAEYASFAAGFDTLVYPAVTGAFGEVGDVDQNGRVVIFYTRAVNELTDAGSGAYVGGYFHPRDLFPTRDRDGLSACETSNFAEMFYMLVPDPTNSVGGSAFSRDLVLQTSLGTIAHEFQHLINASRRLYIIGTTNWNEETWLNEAMSHVTEELVFYRASGFQPRQNLRGPEVMGSLRSSNAYRTYMDQNIRRYQSYLEDPETESPYDFTDADANDLATRGAGWAFLRYAADRRGGDEGQLWRTLIDGSTTGFANLQRALGTDPRPWVRDWAVSVFTDDVVSGIDARFTQPSWRFRTFFGEFPLRTRRMNGPGTVDAFLKAGGSAFVRFGVLPATTASVSGRSPGGQPLPSSVYLTIVRTR